MIENTDYELVPVENDFWHIRILTGDWVETVIQYGTIRPVKKPFGSTMTFNFEVIYSPRDDATPADADLQKTAGDILFNILDSEDITTQKEQDE